MNRRKARVVQLNRSLAIVLPKDWTRGMNIEKGQEIELVYDGEVRVIPQKRKNKIAEAGDS